MSATNQQVDPGFEFITALGQGLSSGNLDLPAFPDVALRIKTALEDPQVSVDKIARIIGADPIFSARILKLANSVMVNGAGVQINEVRMAIARMGLKMAHSTAMTIAVEQLRSAKTSERVRPYLDEVWHHSVQVAAYSYVIAKKQTRVSPDSAMLAGLLHDIGKFYILAQSDHHPELFNSPQTLETIIDEWHTGIGRGILEAWHFSDELCAVADEHEVLDRDDIEIADLSDVVMVANLFDHRDDREGLPELDWDAIPATRRLQLTEENAVEIMQESEKEIQSIIHTLEG